MSPHRWPVVGDGAVHDASLTNHQVTVHLRPIKVLQQQQQQRKKRRSTQQSARWHSCPFTCQCAVLLTIIIHFRLSGHVEAYRQVRSLYAWLVYMSL
jgi:hypothetical protein